MRLSNVLSMFHGMRKPYEGHTLPLLKGSHFSLTTEVTVPLSIESRAEHNRPGVGTRVFVKFKDVGVRAYGHACHILRSWKGPRVDTTSVLSGYYMRYQEGQDLDFRRLATGARLDSKISKPRSPNSNHEVLIRHGLH